MEENQTSVIYLLWNDFKRFEKIIEESPSKIRYLAIGRGTVAVHILKSDLENIILLIKESQLIPNYLVDESDKTVEQINLGISWLM